MKNFKNLISERLKADSAAVSATNAENFGGVTEKIPADVSKVENLKNENEMKENSATCDNVNLQPVQDVNIHLPVEKTIDDVPIYTATAKEIHYWHACVNIHILDFLYPYDLGRSSIAFDSFKIGVDTEKHAITFALDDTHYFKIKLNETNVRPIDEIQAEKVLRKVNSMRFEKIKDNSSLRVRKW